MAAGIAHEIRNPLASMSGSIQILRQELPLTDEQAQLMDIVLRESERLNDTIRSFLAYAKPQRFSIARLDVRRLLSDAAVLLRNSSEVLDGHIIDVHVPPTEVAFEADDNQIRQIVWNLATNGVRAMRDGGRLTLGARVESGGEPSHHSVVLEVSDEGVGIPAEELDAIFQPISRHVLEGHRPGTRDRAPHRQRLRRRDSRQLDAGARDDSQRQAAGESGGHGVNKELKNADPGTRSPEPGTRAQARLLVVDDERSMRELLSIVLRREGYDVTLAENGRAAIDFLDIRRFDLLVSVIKMPDMTGVDVLRAAKRIDRGYPRRHDHGVRRGRYRDQRLWRLGAHHYLQQPAVDVDEN